MKVALATSKDCDCDRESIKAAEKAIKAKFVTGCSCSSVAVPNVC